MRNADVLAAIANEHLQTEVGQFNIEINVRPRSLVGTAVAELEAELRGLTAARTVAQCLQPEDS